MVMVPFCGENLIALLIRFRSTWLTLSGSVSMIGSFPISASRVIFFSGMNPFMYSMVSFATWARSAFLNSNLSRAASMRDISRKSAMILSNLSAFRMTMLTLSSCFWDSFPKYPSSNI